MDVLHFIKSYHDEVRAAFDALEHADSTTNRRSCLDDASRLTQAYLTLERDYLYPEIADLFPGASQLVQLGETHGASIARRLDNLVKLAAKPPAEQEGYDKRLAELREAVLAHFESEEQILMPKMRSMIRTEDREDLGQVFLDAREEVMRLLLEAEAGPAADGQGGAVQPSARGPQRKRA